MDRMGPLGLFWVPWVSSRGRDSLVTRELHGSFGSLGPHGSLRSHGSPVSHRSHKSFWSLGFHGSHVSHGSFLLKEGYCLYNNKNNDKKYE